MELELNEATSAALEIISGGNVINFTNLRAFASLQHS